MSKAIAVQAIFLIGVIAIFLLFIVALFWGWIDTTKLGTNEASCTAKRVSYCSGLLNDKDPLFDWEKKEPLSCDQFGIRKPDNKDDCKI